MFWKLATLRPLCNIASSLQHCVLCGELCPLCNTVLFPYRNGREEEGFVPKVSGVRFTAPAAPDADTVGMDPFPFGGSGLSGVLTTACSKQAPGTRGIQRTSDKCRRQVSAAEVWQSRLKQAAQHRGCRYIYWQNEEQDWLPVLLCFVYLSTHRKNAFESTALKTHLCSSFTSLFRSVTCKDDLFCPSITMLFPHPFPQHPRALLLGYPTQFPLETTATSTETHWTAAAALPWCTEQPPPVPRGVPAPAATDVHCLPGWVGQGSRCCASSQCLVEQRPATSLPQHSPPWHWGEWEGCTRLAALSSLPAAAI